MNYAMENLRVCSSQSEIGQLLNEIQGLDKQFTIWQTLKGKRKVVKALVKKVNTSQNAVSLIPQGDDEFEFDKLSPIYFYSEHKNVVFRSIKQKIGPRYFLLELPQEIHVSELRAETRVSLKGNAKLIFDKFFAYGSDKKEHTCRLFDVSSNGLAFLLASLDRPTFQEGDSIAIKKIATSELRKSANAKLLYIRPLKMKDIATVYYYRVGVALEEKLDLTDIVYN